jgi:hypothetical protein
LKFDFGLVFLKIKVLILLKIYIVAYFLKVRTGKPAETAVIIIYPSSVHSS